MVGVRAEDERLAVHCDLVPGLDGVRNVVI